MARLSTRRLRRALAIAPGLAVAWSVVTFVLVRLTGVGQAEDLGVGEQLLRTALVGLSLGLLSAWLETGPLASWARRLPLWATLVLRTLAYASIVILALAVLIAGISWVESGLAPNALLTNPDLIQAIRQPSFLTFLVLLTLSSFLISFALQLSRVLGRETLRALFLGTYRRPRHEDRVFLFLDLTDSTSIAESLGPLAFTDFKNDFFADVAEPVLATGGRIVQYVGDEVMVAWPMRLAVKTGAPLHFFALVDRRIRQRAERYRQRYGVSPQFKAGCHGGPVVTAEVGDLKRDIVHSGDVVNTAARIEAECRPRGERLLISSGLAATMPVPDGLAVRELGEVSLRGKTATVSICAVSLSSDAKAASPEAASPA